jgi:hypothetical protein
MDLQVASASKFSVKKDGSVSTGVWQGTAVGIAYGGTGQTTASAGFNALSPVTSTGDLIVGNGTNSSTRLGIGSTGQVLTVSGGTATWAAAASGSGTVTSVSVTTANGVSGTVATATTTPAISLSLGDITPTSVALNSDAFLTRDAANILAQRNSTAAQTFRVYNTYTDGSNYERGVFDWTTTANTLTIGTQNAGTGAARNIRFVVGGATKLDYGVTSSGKWEFASDVAIANNNLLLSAGTFGGGVNFVSSGWILNAAAGVIGIYNQGKTDAPRIALGGTTSSFPAIKRSSTTIQARLADDSAFASVQGKLTTDTAYTAGTVVPTGYITIYDSTGTAYRVPCLV